MPELLQFTFSGLTVGAVYALVALGFTLIYNASDVINFAQGEFVMLGGMTTVFLGLAGVPLPLAACLAIVFTVIVGLALHRFAIEPARGTSAVVLIIITIGASIFLRGAAQVVFDKRFHSLPSWFGNDPIRFGGAAILPVREICVRVLREPAENATFSLSQIGDRSPTSGTIGPAVEAEL